MISSSKTLRAVMLVLRIALGAVFVYAAWTKLRTPWELSRCRSIPTSCCR